MKFEIDFSGHKNVRSLHQKTIEITKESHLTPSGDCIVGVNSNYSCIDIPDAMKKKLRNSNTFVKCTISLDDQFLEVKGTGHKDLKLTHTSDIVIRKSNFVCPRTLAINCNKASDSIPRKMIKLLQDPKTKGTITIEIK